MKKFLLILSIFIALGSYCIAQEGVTFEHIGFNQALVKAKETNKLLFIDCYTSWCGPCKRLASEVFTQKIVGDYMNERFVCVKYDVEKDEYKSIASQYKVTCYPTLLIIDSNGELVDRVIGYNPADKLIEAIESTFDKDKSLKGLKEKYENDDSNKQVLAQYLAKLQQSGSPDTKEVAEKLYATLSDQEKSSDTYWYFYSNEKFTPDNSERIEYIKDNYEAFCKNVGKPKVDNVIGRTYEHAMKNAITLNPTVTSKDLKAMKKEFSLFKMTNHDDLMSMWRLALAAQKGSVKEIVSESAKEVDLLSRNTGYWGTIADIVVKSGTRSDKDEWIEVCNQILKITKNNTLITVLNASIELYKK